jgi:hypothetical protein
VQQYEILLMQYAQQIKDAPCPSHRFGTRRKALCGILMGLVNQAQGGQMLAYLQQYKDLNGWLSGNGGYYNPAAIQPGYTAKEH